MLRHPVRRIASAMLNNLHDCPFLRKRYCTSSCKKLKADFFKRAVANDSLVLEYAQCVSGVATRMLNGMSSISHSTGNIGMTNGAQVDTAIDVINKAAFIGITERFQESVSLFVNMFGGDYGYNCSLMSALTAPARQTHYPELENVIVQKLTKFAFEDKSDTLVYEAALLRFQNDMAKYFYH